jgi:hypothetical protein
MFLQSENRWAIGDKIIQFMNDSAIPIIHELAGSAYYDLMKLFLGALL